MHRFFVSNTDISGDKLFIRDKNELNHIKKVLRLKVGDRILVFDGSGYEYEALIVNTSMEIGEATIINKLFNPNNTKFNLSLVQGIAKGDKMDLIVQKAVELGVASIYPVLTEHTVVSYQGDKAMKKVARWKSVAVEACKQCQRNTLLDIKPISSLAKVIKEIDSHNAIMLYEKETDIRLKELLKSLDFIEKNDLFLMVGPEGGFSDIEVALARQNNINIATLGSRILRTETASLIGAAIVLYELGDLG
ncbi:MAG: 16S rRNA (uracil(1498)-N(3))-methyltransferase [Syntrophomonadaceae bacterium]|nr:16S rRNA (uracil(1498)-N(3))-methyltransferase [Syntrophomonadaceae bacterium]